MIVNAAAVKRLREQRAWSQEHLTEVAGLSLRTLQRVEADGTASHATRLALAAAFDCDLAELDLPVQPEAAPETSEGKPSPMPDRAPRNPRALVSLPLIAAGLLCLDWYQHGTIVWAQWSLLGLGIAWLRLAMKTAFRRFGFPGRTKPRKSMA
jgi:transcriptional regulator with XRE-family HTH domain